MVQNFIRVEISILQNHHFLAYRCSESQKSRFRGLYLTTKEISEVVSDVVFRLFGPNTTRFDIRFHLRQFHHGDLMGSKTHFFHFWKFWHFSILMVKWPKITFWGHQFTKIEISELIFDINSEHIGPDLLKFDIYF